MSDSARPSLASGTAKRARGDVAVDVFRGVVVVMMFAVHARRIQTGRGEAPLEGAADASLRFLMRVEPYIAASFLYLVGYSLVLSWSAAAARTDDLALLKRRWKARMLRRAGWLYLLSVGLCLPQFGLQWPATFVSSGILSVIAAAIVVCTLLVSSSGVRRFAWPSCTLVLLVTSALHFARLGVSGLNAGPGGAFPLLAASLFGLVSSPNLVHTSSSAPRWSSKAGGPLAAPALRSPWAVVCLMLAGGELWRSGWDAPWTDTFVSNYRDYHGLAAVYWLEHGPSLPSTWVATGFWNHTTLGLIGCVLAIWFTHQLLHALFNPRAEARAIIPYKPIMLTALGEHALVAYITHLIALGLVEMLGLAPASSLGTWCLVALLVFVSLALAPLVNRRFRRRL
ncbi:MAG: DUF1624 domain-containing protein [Myxococcales bacterium]|nr:DUF1624 domain-containing protein [Myxococcales bacterium]